MLIPVCARRYPGDHSSSSAMSLSNQEARRDERIGPKWKFCRCNKIIVMEILRFKYKIDVIDFNFPNLADGV